MDLSEYYKGVIEILEESKSVSKTKGPFTIYSSSERNKCLNLLGWPDGQKNLGIIIKKLIEDKLYLRAAFIAIVNFDLKKTLEALKPIKNEEIILYSIIKSLENDFTSTTMSKICVQLARAPKNGYIECIYTFLGGSIEYSKYTEKLLFPDNLAFGCIFLPDYHLKTQCKRFIASCIPKGDLNGIVFSGFNTNGLEIMESYLQTTLDIQTIGLLSIHARFINSDPKLIEWTNLYKSKLNSLELWIFRAKLEIDESKLFKSCKENLKTSKCIDCNSLLKFQYQISDPWIEKDHGKKYIAVCSNCPNSSLCCSVCLLPYGSSSFDKVYEPIQEDWFVWCENCNHGGHAEHILQWFQEYKVCSVVDCLCKCDNIGKIEN